MKLSLSTSSNCCEHCLVKAPRTMRCSACKTVVYCSPNCQALDWVVHKHICQHTKEDLTYAIPCSPNFALEGSFHKSLILLIRKLFVHCLIVADAPDIFHIRDEMTLDDVQRCSPLFLKILYARYGEISKSVFIRIQQSVAPKLAMLLPYTPYAKVLTSLSNSASKHIPCSYLGICFNTDTIPPLNYNFDMFSLNCFVQQAVLNPSLKTNVSEVRPPYLPPFFKLGIELENTSLSTALAHLDCKNATWDHFFILPNCDVWDVNCRSHLVFREGKSTCGANTCTLWENIPPILLSALQAYTDTLYDCLLALNGVEKEVLKAAQTEAAGRLKDILSGILGKMQLCTDLESSLLPLYLDTAPILYLKHAYFAIMQSARICSHCFNGSIVNQVETVVRLSPFADLTPVDLALTMLRVWVRLESKHSCNPVLSLFEVICLCNAYLTQKLERMAPPPIRKHKDDKLSPDVLQRLKDAADALAPQHIKFLGLLEEIYQIADDLQVDVKEGPLVTAYDALEKLIGQVEARLEDIESWTDKEYGTPADPNLEVCGTPIT